MTEAEWLGWSDPVEFLGRLRYWQQPRSPFSDRRLRLFAAATARRVVGADATGSVSVALVAAEEAADARTNEVRERLKRVRISLHGTCTDLTYIELVNAIVRRMPLMAAISTAQCGVFATSEERARERERVALGLLLRDIIGNPIHPVAFSPDWRTSTVLALAAQMYESREFSAMPILADALQDAGCDNADVLSHCRDAGAPHVRGCWVVDLVLGKQ